MSNIRAGNFTATTTVQRLPNVAAKRVFIDGGTAYAGGSDLTAGNPPTSGFNLAAVDHLALEVDNLDEIYVVHATGTATINWLVEQ